MNIFVGNLSFEAKESDVEKAFAAFGTVASVAIVMEKKGKKSRGFGFVEMPNEEEGKAAIEGLMGKDILGRPLNVMLSDPKEPKKQFTGEKDKRLPVYKRTGKYREGRRTINYLKERIATGVATPMGEKRQRPNPLRWRKKSSWASSAPTKIEENKDRPWERNQTESRPWRKPFDKTSSWKKPEGGASRPWRKPEGATSSRPWKKPEGGASRPWRKPEGVTSSGPWKKPEGASKPWERNRAPARPWAKSEGSESRPWKRTEGVYKPWQRKPEGAPTARPWKKPEGATSSRPWKKPEGGSKLWAKEKSAAAKPRFKGRSKFGSR
jgi:hypothetical protein